MSTIKKLPQAQSILSHVQTADPVAKAKLEEAVKSVAGVDGDRVLDQFEAEALKITIDEVTQGSTAPLTAAQVEAVQGALALRVAQLKGERVAAADAIFTSEGGALQSFRGKILGAMEDTIRKANGRPVDINMMVFSFTDTVLADEILRLARENPHANFRLLTDWSQMSSSGNRQSARLARTAFDEGLDNLDIKFKKDNPYVWDPDQGRPVFSHRHTTGLNHHKGFVTLIDGRPQKMVCGSFNWSMGAMTRNYENLMSLDRKDPDHRGIMNSYEKEFEGFWNRDDVALTYAEARKEKDRIFRSMYEANGVAYTSPANNLQDVEDPIYRAEPKGYALDINAFSDANHDELVGRVGKSMADTIEKEVRDFGRIDTWAELMIRVPGLAAKPAWVHENLRANIEFGDGGVSINTATVDELDRAGVSRKQAERIVAFRESHGYFESVDELDDVKGIGAGTLDRIKPTLNAELSAATFSARAPDGSAATTGWSSDHHGTWNVPSEGAESDDIVRGRNVPTNRNEVEAIRRDMAAPVIDMLRRAQPGETFRLVMYGISTGSKEYAALKEALARGVKVKAVIYKSYNANALADMQKLIDEGHDLEIKTFTSKVMHEKFGVIGDDVFNGSANWSNSSISKHTEDRFLFMNQPDVANRFIEEFERLWDRASTF
ncbi:MAG: hypothetical protein CMH56_03385 [Myxococcales bacterium]|nr:hypothetical protein [Myxococcales bacterium]